MCGKASVSHLSWKDIYAWASSLKAPVSLPDDPQNRINISPSRLKRKTEPDSMVWESLPVIYHHEGLDHPTEAIWPYIPMWANGQLPRNRTGKLISTANARLRAEGEPFAPTFMTAWRKALRVLVFVSWFYEFDSRVRPQIPYGVFPLNRPFWAMAGLASAFKHPDGTRKLSVAIITVNPNEVLKSVGHHRSPALLQTPGDAESWLKGTPEEALRLLKPFPDEFMGVEEVPMEIKIPGNQNLRMPGTFSRGGDKIG